MHKQTRTRANKTKDKGTLRMGILKMLKEFIVMESK